MTLSNTFVNVTFLHCASSQIFHVHYISIQNVWFKLWYAKTVLSQDWRNFYEELTYQSFDKASFSTVKVQMSDIFRYYIVPIQKALFHALFSPLHSKCQKRKIQINNWNKVTARFLNANSLDLIHWYNTKFCDSNTGNVPNLANPTLWTIFIFRKNTTVWGVVCRQ